MSEIKYSLDIENVGGDYYIVMSRGHHDIHEFMKKVREDGYDWPLGVPKHVYVKQVPANKHSNFSCLYQLFETPKAGRFPATYSWEAYGDDRYEAKFPSGNSESGKL